MESILITGSWLAECFLVFMMCWSAWIVSGFIAAVVIAHLEVDVDTLVLGICLIIGPFAWIAVGWIAVEKAKRWWTRRRYWST